MTPTTMQLSPLLAIIFLSATLSAQVVLNELIVSSDGVDAEFAEIFNPGPDAIDLEDWTLEVFESDAGEDFGKADRMVLFEGGSLAAGDHYLVAGPGFEQAYATSADLAIPNNFFENSSHTVILRDSSGTRRFSVFINDGGAGDAANDAGTVIEPDLTVGPVGGGLPPGYALLPDGGNSALPLEAGVPAPSATPGQANPPFRGPLSVSLDRSSIPEDGSASITGTVSIPGPAGAELVVSVELDDESEAAVEFPATIPTGQASGTFSLVAVDDLWPDGDQAVTVRVSAPAYGTADAGFTVVDDDSDFQLVINEAYNHIEGAPADANGDGTSDADDEFVEILNLSGQTINLSGYSLSDPTFERHLFPYGTILEDGGSILVFAGGDVEEGSGAAFGNTEVQIARSNPLFPGLLLDDGGDVLTLADPFGVELHSLVLPDQSTATQPASWVAASDGQPALGSVRHHELPGAHPYSPGTASDGSPFRLLERALVLELNGEILVEGDGLVSSAGRVSVPEPVGHDLVVRISSSDPSEIDTTASSPLVIPAGELSVGFALQVIDDLDADGPQSVRISARASGYLNGGTDTEVFDNGDAPAFTDLVINEVDAQTPGADQDEFVELYNRSSAEQSLEGLLLVFFNGNGDKSYRAIPLDGFTIPANGFFVVGSEGVPRVDYPALGNGAVQNGPDAVALFAGDPDEFPTGTPATTTAGQLIDAVVHDDGDGIDEELLEALTPGAPMAREDMNGDADTDSASRVPDGGDAFASGLYWSVRATPGLPNESPSAEGFELWALAAGLSGGADGDDDSDRLSNLLEYALGLDPLSPEATHGSFDGKTLSFFKGPEAAADASLVYTIETSTDLGPPWTAVVATEDADSISYTLPAGPGSLFARLRVTRKEGAVQD